MGSPRFRISWVSDTLVQGAESYMTENPLVHLDGLKIKCSVFVVLCLKPCPAQYGTTKHCRENCPSLFSCKPCSHLLMHLPPYVVCPVPPTAARAVFVPGPFVPGAFPRTARGSSTDPLRAGTRRRGTRQRHNAACDGSWGVSRSLTAPGHER